MNAIKTLIALATIAAAGSSFAQEASSDAWMQAAASKSRDQVAAELAQARKDGSIKSVSATYDFVKASPAVKTRAQVQAETLAAIESGELQALNAEASAFRAAQRPVSARAN